MADVRRFLEAMRRFRRWLHTTAHALEAAQLLIAVAAAGAILLVFAAVSEVGVWAWVAAVVPVARQGRDQLRTSRRRHSDQKRDLSMASLAGADLTGAELATSYFRNKDLTDARLVQANLVGADLTGATLAGARLRKANLAYGSLAGADCPRANFFRAKLVDVDLSGIEARGASFESADLRSACLVGADLLGASFRGADARGADFTDAKLAADALADAVVDVGTTLPSGRPATVTPGSSGIGWRHGFGLAARGGSGGLARPAMLGLVWAAAIGGTAMAADLSGGGLAEELAEAARSEPLARPAFETGSVARPDIDRRELPAGTFGGALLGNEERATGDSVGALPVDRLPGDPGMTDDGDLERSSTESDGVIPPLADNASDSSGDRRSDGADPVVGTEPSPPADQDLLGDPIEGSTVPPAVATGPDADEPADQPLTEVSVPTSTAVQTALPRVQLVVGSDGGPSTAVFVTALGRSEPRTVDGQAGWALDVPSGGVSVEVVPSDGAVATTCIILVDDVQRSFQASLAGQTSTCRVDLDGAG